MSLISHWVKKERNGAARISNLSRVILASTDTLWSIVSCGMLAVGSLLFTLTILSDILCIKKPLIAVDPQTLVPAVVQTFSTPLMVQLDSLRPCQNRVVARIIVPNLTSPTLSHLQPMACFTNLQDSLQFFKPKEVFTRIRRSR